jgi:hypothetical protein
MHRHSISEPNCVPLSMNFCRLIVAITATTFKYGLRAEGSKMIFGK